MFCKTYNESLQKQAVNMDVQCILCIANSSYAVKTPKDEVTCDTYWNFYKNWKLRYTSLKTGDFEIKREDGRQPLKTGVSRSKRESWNVWPLSTPLWRIYFFTNFLLIFWSIFYLHLLILIDMHLLLFVCIYLHLHSLIFTHIHLFSSARIYFHPYALILICQNLSKLFFAFYNLCENKRVYEYHHLKQIFYHHCRAYSFCCVKFFTII